MQQQPHKPTTPPTPEDPRLKTPMQDPPVQPEHDDRGDKTKIAGWPREAAERLTPFRLPASAFRSEGYRQR